MFLIPCSFQLWSALGRFGGEASTRWSELGPPNLDPSGGPKKSCQDLNRVTTIPGRSSTSSLINARLQKAAHSHAAYPTCEPVATDSVASVHCFREAACFVLGPLNVLGKPWIQFTRALSGWVKHSAVMLQKLDVPSCNPAQLKICHSTEHKASALCCVVLRNSKIMFWDSQSMRVSWWHRSGAGRWRFWCHHIAVSSI